VLVALRGIFGKHNFIKFADMPCGVCGGGCLHAVVLCGWKDRGEVSAVHGKGKGEHEVNQIRRCRAPIVDVAAARLWLRGGVPT